MEGTSLRRSAIILGRVLGFIEIADLVAGSQVFFPDLVRQLAERYSFQKFPQTIDEFDVKKGVEFLQGKSGGNPIQKFVVWDTLLVLETRLGTSVSKAILEEILLWSAENLGLNYEAGSIKRFGYISDITFYSDAPLLSLCPAVSNLAVRSSAALSQIWEEPVNYESLIVKVGHDPIARKYGIAPFLIEHRAETKFSENKYFSEAPLPTDMHFEILEQFEKDVLLSGMPHR